MAKFLILLAILLSSTLLIYPTTPIHTASSVGSGDPLPLNTFVELAKAVNPAVVSVSISFQHRQQQRGMHRDPFQEFFEEFFRQDPRFRQQPPEKQKVRPVGTGFIIEPGGLAVTNNHVIEMADEIEVQLQQYPNRSFPAKVIGRDPRTDIALIQIEAGVKLPTIKLGKSENVQVGEWVAAFGNPFGHTFSLSKGIISAIGRNIDELNVVPFLQTDASINPGNSGGPLVNLMGEVIGVNTAIDARAQGIGFAIPIDFVKQIIPELKAHGKVKRGHIGVIVNEVNSQTQKALGLPIDHGVVIMDIVPNSPADKAGLKPYDVIVKFNGKTVKKFSDLSNSVAVTPIGKKSEITVYRGGKERKLSISVGEPVEEETIAERSRGQRPPLKGEVPIDKTGMKVVPYTKALAKQYEFPPSAPQKPIVVEIIPNSPAAKAGLRVGDMVLDVNKEPIRNPKDISDKLVKGSNMLRVQHKNAVSLIFLSL